MTNLLLSMYTNPFRAVAAMGMMWATALAALPAAGQGATADLFVPIVLTSGGAAGSFYTTELTLVNRGTTPATIEVTYTAAFGGGSGKFEEALQPGEQKVIPDAIAYLVARGLPLPATGNRGGTLALAFHGLSSSDAAAVTAKTTTATRAPQPVGAAGLAYPAVLPSEGITTAATLYGLRATAADRSNVALFNQTSEPVTVRVTAHAGDGSGASAVKEAAAEIPGLGWTQISNVFDGTGFTSGWVTFEKTGGAGAFGLYGVVNCNGTSDGSYLPPTVGGASGSRITVPVLVETTSGFLSELVLANRSAVEVTLTLDYVESLAPTLGPGGEVTLALPPRTQLIVPDALEYLRGQGIAIGPKGATHYAGALRVLVQGAALSDVFAGARTAALSPSAGQFGLFTPGVYEGQEASTEAWLYGLRADETNRTNVAALNAGAAGVGSVTLEFQAYDGDAGGVPRGDPDRVTLEPGGWYQASSFLGNQGVRNGWVRVRRLEGIAPWIAYAVVNDGARSGERTGDGAFVPMVVSSPPSSWQWEVSILTDPGGKPYRPTLTFSHDGNPAIGYYVSTGFNLAQIKVARWDPATASWQFVSFDEGSGAFHLPGAATDPRDGNPSIAYGFDAIKLAHWTGTNWSIETVETVGQVSDAPSLVYGPDGNPSISYRAKTPVEGLRFARWNGSAWIKQVVDTDPMSNVVSSLAYDGQGNPAIAYGTRSAGAAQGDTLKLARWTGSEWKTEIVESGVVAYGWNPSLAFDATGSPAITHGRGVDAPPGIRYVRWDGSRWIGEFVYSDYEPGNLRFDSSGVACVSLRMGTSEPTAAGIARRGTGGAWATEIVEGGPSNNMTPNMALDPAGMAAMVYGRAEPAPGGGEVRSIGLARMKSD